VKKTVQRDLLPGALEMMILRILRRQPLHGYALVQHIKRTSHDLLQIEEGSLYPAMQRAEREQSTWSVSQLVNPHSAIGRRLLKAELVKAEWGQL
jgi:PadR family transcriptional regulator, regulatory protein PadR